MAERRYTLSEIDAMRAYFREQTEVVRVIVEPADYGEHDPSEWDEVRPITHKEAEEQLRTAMLGGVDPAEVIAVARKGGG